MGLGIALTKASSCQTVSDAAVAQMGDRLIEAVVQPLQWLPPKVGRNRPELAPRDHPVRCSNYLPRTLLRPPLNVRWCAPPHPLAATVLIVGRGWWWRGWPLLEGGLLDRPRTNPLPLFTGAGQQAAADRSTTMQTHPLKFYRVCQCLLTRVRTGGNVAILSDRAVGHGGIGVYFEDAFIISCGHPKKAIGICIGDRVL